MRISRLGWITLPVLLWAGQVGNAQTMLLDVVEAVASWRTRPEVALVTGDGFAIDLAKRFSFEVIRDDASLGETDAITMATRLCESRGIESTLVIPGDIPLVTADELEKILRACSDHLQRACEEMIETANEHGGIDNISVLVGRRD